MVFSLEHRDKNKLSIVLDMDDTLARHSSSLEDEEKLYLLRKSMILFAVQREHQIFPGVIELMQVLHSKSYINLAFFSSAVKERNTEFVEKLLTRALGQERYSAVRPSVAILSRDDLTPGDREQGEQMRRNYGLSSGTNKKDISKALGKDGSITNAVLVDDDSSYIFPGQEKNFLRSLSGRAEYYTRFNEMTEREFNQSEFCKYNSVFFIAGVLADCIAEFEKGNDITELLFDISFTKNDDTLFGYKPNYRCAENRDYYEKGLLFLRTVNPNLCFVSLEDYIATVEAPATEEEQQIIADSKTKKSSRGDECRIM